MYVYVGGIGGVPHRRHTIIRDMPGVSRQVILGGCETRCFKQTIVTDSSEQVADTLA